MNPRLILRQAALGDVLARIALPPDGSDDGIRASREVQLPMRLPLLCGVEPYARLLARLRATALRPEAVRVFPYDWRRSIVDAARELVPVAERHLAAWTARWATLPLEERHHLPEPSLTLVCHSMGGLVGRWFAEVEGGRGAVRRVVTLGTPFAGSLNALRVLAEGNYLPFGLLARSLRDSGRSFPGLYELVAHYPCVTDPDGGRARFCAISAPPTSLPSALTGRWPRTPSTSTGASRRRWPPPERRRAPSTHSWGSASPQPKA